MLEAHRCGNPAGVDAAGDKVGAGEATPTVPGPFAEALGRLAGFLAAEPGTSPLEDTRNAARGDL